MPTSTPPTLHTVPSNLRDQLPPPSLSQWKWQSPITVDGGGCVVIERAGFEAGVQDADEPVGELPQRRLVVKTTVCLFVVVAACAGRGLQCELGLRHDRVGEPVVMQEPQTRGDWRLIVVENGNSDEMARIIEQLHVRSAYHADPAREPREQGHRCRTPSSSSSVNETARDGSGVVLRPIEAKNSRGF